MLSLMGTRLLTGLLLAAQVFLGAGGGAFAAEPAKADPGPSREDLENPKAREVVLDTLFGQLAHAKTAEEGKAIEAAIFQIWMASGSPSIDILMRRGLDAFAEKDYDRALFYFNEVVTLAPDFVEGWDKRAAVYFLKDDYASALRDIERVLKLEPRHFSAMAGLAVILEDLGDKKGALELFRRSLKLDPWLDGAAQAERALSVDVEGRGI
jgi:tetratricopeptide (TPR) repeat protein